MYSQRRPIARIPASKLTVDFFREEIYRPHRPVVIEGYLDPKTTGEAWSVEQLTRRFGEREVDVKMFEGEPRAHGLRFKGLCQGSLSMRFADFLEHSTRAFEGGLTHYLRLSKSSAQIPELFEDVTFPELFNATGTRIDRWRNVDTLVRIGATSYEYPAHCDGFENLLIQLCGLKHVVFFEPGEVSRLYLDREDLHRSSVNDMDEPDLTRFPDFAHTSPLSCTLYPGDLLYIPVLWFHNIRGEGWCVSTSQYHVQPDKLGYIETYKPPAWRQYEEQHNVRIY